MPIYAYRCDSCGHAKDVLQKISDPVLSTCPACGAEAFQKQVTAAGFQLKGSGWYVTDFREGAKAKAKPDAAVKDTAPSDGAAAESPKTESAKTETTPAVSVPAAATAPAPASAAPPAK